ncbi:unnamed protein product [Lactuca saligna]|uniref:Uncharacterized protein n=1 Tax=Lactuca saligna TaxID=75948 RepID=A0AA36EHZ7_LACSI|nr:unnamed protein product [Lactuca saligna]
MESKYVATVCLLGPQSVHRALIRSAKKKKLTGKWTHFALASTLALHLLHSIEAAFPSTKSVLSQPISFSLNGHHSSSPMLLSILFSLAGNLCRCHPLHRQPPPSLSNFQLPKTSQYLLTSPSFIIFLFHHQLDSINFNVIAIFSHKIDFFSIAGMLTPYDRQGAISIFSCIELHPISGAKWNHLKA